MNKRTQETLEIQLLERRHLIKKGAMSEKEAFSTIEDWIIELRSHRLLLNPLHRKWLYYNRSHDTWDYTGYGVGEVIFITIGNTLGAKKVPSDNKAPVSKSSNNLISISDWYLYLSEGRLKGPIDKTELSQKLTNGDIPVDTLVFSAAMIEWQRADKTGLVKTARKTVPQPPSTKNKTSLYSTTTAQDNLGQQPIGSCPMCTIEYVEGDAFCANCGFDLRTIGRTCQQCGGELQHDDVFCPNCGKKLAD